jgi:peptide/nickel transport system permease protein
LVRYVVRRLIFVVGVLWALTVVIFGITQLLPGNVAVMILGAYQNPVSLAALTRKLGLDQPITVQYWHWFSAFVHGDMGTSLSNGLPVAPQVLQAFGATLILAVPAMVIVTVVGIGIGVIGAVNRDKWPDHLTAVASYVGISVPEFFWGIVLIVIFAGYFKVLPSGGSGAFATDPLSWASYLVLPVLTLTITLTAQVARQARSSMLDALDSNYVRSARARGLPARTVVLRHALRNALLPTITVLALNVSYLVGGIVVVESVFGYPGIGRLTLYAIQERDLPLMQACILVASAAFVLAVLASDLLYAYLDPRIRYGRVAK